MEIIERGGRRAIGMEMQAQYPSSAAEGPFPPNYPPRKAHRLTRTGAAPFFHTNDPVAQLGNLPGTFLPQQRLLIHGTNLLSGEAESGLTCNASASCKRALLDGNAAHAMLQLNLRQRLHVPGEEAPPVKAATAAAGACAGTPPSFQASYEKIRLDDSAMASTSGRSPVGAPVLAATVPAISPLMEEHISQVYQEKLEVDAFIRLQNERIRSGLEDARKRHHRALLSAVEQGVLRRLREKEAELESASHRNAELEEKIRQLASENQIWFDVARNNEAIVSGLRTNLEQVLLQNTGGAVAAAAGAAIMSVQTRDWEEGNGESDRAAPVFPAEDAQSCCYEGAPAAAGEAEHDTAGTRENLRELRLRRACRVCLKREVAVLLLPCRHLCLCRQCDPGVDACPVCNATKNASLQVFMC